MTLEPQKMSFDPTCTRIPHSSHIVKGSGRIRSSGSRLNKTQFKTRHVRIKTWHLRFQAHMFLTPNPHLRVKTHRYLGHGF